MRPGHYTGRGGVLTWYCGFVGKAMEETGGQPIKRMPVLHSGVCIGTVVVDASGWPRNGYK